MFVASLGYIVILCQERDKEIEKWVGGRGEQGEIKEHQHQTPG
jgi:hypothetical protein